jgi:phage gpG-like protein
MLQLNLDGQNDLIDRFSAMPERLRAALAAKSDALAQRLCSTVVDEKLAGGVLNVASGTLRNSIRWQVIQQGDQIGASIFSDGSAPYAAIQEYGGKSAAHDILPDKARALAFLIRGKMAFARVVHHPGSQIPERSYLRSALDEQGGAINQAFAETLTGLARQLNGG